MENKPEICHENYRVVFEDEELYVDNQSRKRSGHMTHAMTELSSDAFIDFNSNCSAVRLGGHSAYGWVEYRISEDNGRTYGETRVFPYSWESFLDGDFTVSVEKAVTCDDGTVVAFCLRNTMLEPCCCEPWLTPMCCISTDNGQTWQEPYECIPYPGRIYDAVYRDGVIYALIFCNERFAGASKENVYRVYASYDSGRSFEELSVVPYPDTFRRGYGAMMFDTSGILHTYAYSEMTECYMDHVFSRDNGKTWTVTEPCYVAKGIRNPQMAYIDGVYILHGRGEKNRDFVAYSSEDAVHWDEGVYLGRKTAGCYYSNNIVRHDDKGNFLLIQYSDLYGDKYQVNVMHRKLRIVR